MVADAGGSNAAAQDDASLNRSRRITHAITHCVNRIADLSGAKAIFAYADAIEDMDEWLSDLGSHKLYIVTKTERESDEQADLGRHVLRVPNVSLSRFGQMKIAVLLALSKRLISEDDVVLCIIGAPASGTLDTLAVLDVSREFETLLTTPGARGLSDIVSPEVLERVLGIAAELGSEGREGKPVGTLFVIGDPDRITPLTKQVILNPFAGYPEERRNLLDETLEETVKELASIDGAFLVRSDGVLISAGAYLKASGQSEFELPAGLGARHQAAAAITDLVDCLAICISESTGTVTVFRGGHIVAEIEKPRRPAERMRKEGE